MENLSRNMDGKYRIMEQKKKSDSKSWTVLVIGDKERIRSFEITKKLIVTLIVIILGFMAGVPATFWFLDRVNFPTETELVEKLKNTQSELKIIKEENRRFEVKIQTLNDELTLTKQKLENAIQTTKSPEVLPSTDEKTVALRAEEKPSVPEPYVVSIDDLEAIIDKITSTFNFNFTLRNKAESNVTISGYVFVILKSDISDIESWRTYPKTSLKDGRPQNFRVGERFSISRFRDIKGKIRKIPAQESYDLVTILVFSEEGDLILEENIDFKNLTE